MGGADGQHSPAKLGDKVAKSSCPETTSLTGCSCLQISGQCLMVEIKGDECIVHGVRNGEAKPMVLALPRCVKIPSVLVGNTEVKRCSGVGDKECLGEGLTCRATNAGYLCLPKPDPSSPPMPKPPTGFPPRGTAVLPLCPCTEEGH